MSCFYPANKVFSTTSTVLLLPYIEYASVDKVRARDMGMRGAQLATYSANKMGRRFTGHQSVFRTLARWKVQEGSIW